MRDNVRQRAIRDAIRREMVDNIPEVTVTPLDKRIKEDILEGGMGIFGSGGCGKTNLTYLLGREMLKDELVQLKVFDKAQNWIHDFDELLYQNITEHTIYNEGVYFDDESIILNLKGMLEPKLIRETVKEIIKYDYIYQQELKEIGELNRYILYIIEESQNILGSVGLNSIWNTYISDGRNFNLSFIFTGRRMAQLSAKVRGNLSCYIWGKTIESVDLDRIKKITKDDKIITMLPTLERGEFIYYAGGKPYLIPKTNRFEPVGHPIRWRG